MCRHDDIDGGGPLGRRRFLFTSAALGAGLLTGDARGQPPIRQPDSAGAAAFAARAAAMRAEALRTGDQGYGAVIVLDGRIIGEAPSRVVVGADPTAHAEMEAIRDACRRLGAPTLPGAVMYGTSPACAMCEAAAYWAGLSRLYYGPAAAGGRAPRLRRC